MLSEAGHVAVRAAAQDFMADSDEVVLRLERAVVERLELAGSEPHLRASLRASCEANIALLAGLLGSGADPRTIPLAPEAVQFVVDVARAGDPAWDFLRVYRVAQGELWAQWQHRLRAHTPDADTLDETTTYTSAFIFEAADSILMDLRSHYDAEVERLATRVETLRVEAIRDLLASSAPDVAAASARLRYELDRWHVGVAVAATDGASASEKGVRARLEGAVAAVAGALRGTALVMPDHGGDVVHGWVGADRTADTREVAGVPGTIVALGRPGRRLAGFRTTHSDAARALDLARGLGRPPGAIVRYEDVEVLALLYADPEEATRFAAATLEPVLVQRGTSDDLITTLAALHEADLNVGLTAERLHVHRNTVAYRVRRFLELVGETDPGSLRVRAAIALAPLVLGERRLPGDSSLLRAGRDHDDVGSTWRHV